MACFKYHSMKTTKLKLSKKRTGGETHMNTELMKVLAFGQQTMETLSEFHEQLKTQFNIDLALQERS